MNSLSAQQIDKFIQDGYVKINNAVPRNTCDEIREILWKDIDVDRDDRSTWTKPVIRLMFYNQEPFCKAVNMPVLRNAYDQLAGRGRWIPRNSIGTFPVRFPSITDPGDTGWHVDSSFPGPDATDFSTWRVNVFSRGRALLMLFLFSDIDSNDAPTIIRNGSHRDVARILGPHGEAGLSFMELAAELYRTEHRNTSLATGAAGTVYLCHPFIVHAAQPHHGTFPRFLAQPSLELKGQLRVIGQPLDDCPVARAIQLALK